ncbi:hypothetical protein Q1695_011326 [Nippostrongylus brasiliensis]|nr:hypothetical protein Q1695_011326 [Nippostrongylus brasiliensis]
MAPKSVVKLKCWIQDKAREVDIFAVDDEWPPFFGLAAANGLLYAASGGSGSQALNSVEVYDPRACRWTTAQPLLKKRYDAGVTVFRDQLVVVGGYDENKMDLSSAEMLTDNGWTFLPEISVPRRGLGVVNVDGSLFAFGGINDDHHCSCIEYMDFDSSQWEMSQACLPGLFVHFFSFLALRV